MTLHLGGPSSHVARPIGRHAAPSATLPVCFPASSPASAWRRAARGTYVFRGLSLPRKTQFLAGRPMVPVRLGFRANEPLSPGQTQAWPPAAGRGSVSVLLPDAGQDGTP